MGGRHGEIPGQETSYKQQPCLFAWYTSVPAPFRAVSTRYSHSRDQPNSATMLPSKWICQPHNTNERPILSTTNLGLSLTGSRSLIIFLCKEMKNVSCEYDRLNGWNSTLQAAWQIRHARCCCLHVTPPYLPNDIASAVHPVSVRILHPREIQIMWSHTVRQKKTDCEVIYVGKSSANAPGTTTQRKRHPINKNYIRRKY